MSWSWKNLGNSPNEFLSQTTRKFMEVKRVLESCVIIIAERKIRLASRNF